MIIFVPQERYPYDFRSISNTHSRLVVENTDIHVECLGNGRGICLAPTSKANKAKHWTNIPVYMRTNSLLYSDYHRPISSSARSTAFYLTQCTHRTIHWQRCAYMRGTQSMFSTYEVAPAAGPHHWARRHCLFRRSCHRGPFKLLSTSALGSRSCRSLG